MKFNRRYFLLGFATSIGEIFVDRSLGQNTIKSKIADRFEKNFRILVLSDLNSQYGSTSYEPSVTRAIAMIPKLQPDLILCAGDAIAGQKRTLSKSQIEAMWASFVKAGIPLPLTAIAV